MNELESAILIEKLKVKDPEIVNQFVRYYTKNLVVNTRKLGFSKEETEDIVQLTWITFFDVLNNFENRSSLKTFLFGILFNKIHEYKRKNFRHKNHEVLDQLFSNEYNSKFDDSLHWNYAPMAPEVFKLKAEVLSIIEKCSEILPLKQKMAFLLKEVQEEESVVICNQLKISNSNLGVLLFRARNQLRLCVESKEE